MYKLLLLVVILCPMLVDAKQDGKANQGVNVNPDGTYSITRAIFPNEPTAVVEKEAEAFCAKRGRYYYDTGNEFETYFWTLRFKCITDKKESERQKRLRETLLDGQGKKNGDLPARH